MVGSAADAASVVSAIPWRLLPEGSRARPVTATDVLNRLMIAIVTLFGVAVIVFVLIRVVPGDPIAMMIAPGASADDITALRARYGLDASIPVQFGLWLQGVVAGDFGTSISMRRPALEIVASRLPATIELAVLAITVAVLGGSAVAIASTLLRRSRLSGLFDGINSLFISIPDFIWAFVLVLLFGFALPVLPLTGRIDPSIQVPFTTRFYLSEAVLTGNLAIARDVLAHMLMPTLALALPLAAVIGRVLRQSLNEAMVQDYVTLARIKGHSELRLVLQEALRNAVGPTLALTGVQFTFLVGGTVIVERIFAYPGVGNLAIDAVINRDFPLIQCIVLTFGLIFIVVNIVVDMLAVALNPRLRHG